MRALRAVIPVALFVLAPMGMLHTLWADPTSAGEDDVIYYYPLRTMVGQALREGRWPLANRFEATGTPLMADPQSAVMYPPTWLFAALPAKPAYSLTLLMAFTVAGLGTYAYLRRLGLACVAAAFGATAFMFCGFLVGHRVHWSILHAAAYLPWGLWCIEALRDRTARAFAGLVPVGYLAIAAGHWPTFVHMALIWSAYLLFRGRPLWRAVLVATAALLLAAALTGPQIDLTRRLLSLTTRNRIGYATAGENSFFPAAGVLALFPMLMGSRTPGFYPQAYWGPWHLCEMLGYAGLGTLVLAGSAVRRFYRGDRSGTAGGHSAAAARGEDCSSSLASPAAGAGSSVVRAWTWIGLGAGVWMLGYYLPTYRLIHMIPYLGVIRCPARMVLAVDMALATLAAIAVHAIVACEHRREGNLRTGEAADRPDRAALLRRDLRRGVSIVLPAAMLAALGVTAAAGGISVAFFGGEISWLGAGAGWRALEAVIPTNPAVWVPLVLAALTLAAVRFWLGGPRRRAAVLVAVLLVDLFSVARFVDVRAAGESSSGPEESPAAEWLRENAPKGEPFLVWGIGETYFDRAAELLRPKTAHCLGVGTINTYGPFQSPVHARLFGFRIFGTNRDWARLLRRNDLLSLYGVRYVLTARQDVRDVLESVRVPTAPAPPDGPNLLSDEWRLDRVEQTGGILRLRTPSLWHWSIAKQPVALRPATVYRISLDARGPDAGAAARLRAEVFWEGMAGGYAVRERLGLTAFAEQVGPDWQHFEWTFRAPDELPGQVQFRVFTTSERAVEVRRISLRASHWDEPVGPFRPLGPGQRVYRRAAQLPALDPADPPIAIYENRLCLPAASPARGGAASARAIESLKWRRRVTSAPSGAEGLPAVGLAAEGNPRWTLLVTTLPAGVLYLGLAGGALWIGRRRRGTTQRADGSPPATEG